MRLTGHVVQWGRTVMHIDYWWGNPEGKSLLGEPRRRWVINIRIDHRDIGGGYRLDLSGSG
jgi:hypothetical protein